MFSATCDWFCTDGSHILSSATSGSVCFQLLQIIRENNIVIIVGETGSGKTTQLTQVGETICDML